MNTEEKKKAPIVLSIISIIVAFGFPVFSIIFGIFGLALANSHQKESGLDYKTEKFSLFRDCVRDCAFCTYLYRTYLTTFGNSLKQKSFKTKAFLFYPLFSK